MKNTLVKVGIGIGWLFMLAMVFYTIAGCESTPVENGDVHDPSFLFIMSELTVWTDCDSIHIEGTSTQNTNQTLYNYNDYWIVHLLKGDPFAPGADTVLTYWTGDYGITQDDPYGPIDVNIALAHDYCDAPLDVYIRFALAITPAPWWEVWEYNTSFPTDCPLGSPCNPGGGGHGGKGPFPEMSIREDVRLTAEFPCDHPHLAVKDHDELLWDYLFWHNRYPGGSGAGGGIRGDSLNGYLPYEFIHGYTLGGFDMYGDR